MDFALEFTKHSLAWTKQLAYLIRAVLIGHVFVNGNKRTACAMLLATVEMNQFDLEKKQAIAMVKTWVTKHETSIENIQRRIENAITKK